MSSGSGHVELKDVTDDRGPPISSEPRPPTTRSPENQDGDRKPKVMPRTSSRILSTKEILVRSFCISTQRRPLLNFTPIKHTRTDTSFHLVSSLFRPNTTLNLMSWYKRRKRKACIMRTYYDHLITRISIASRYPFADMMKNIYVPRWILRSLSIARSSILFLVSHLRRNHE
jgi:hypothetical protein